MHLIHTSTHVPMVGDASAAATISASSCLTFIFRFPTSRCLFVFRCFYRLHRITCIGALSVFCHVLPADARPSALHEYICHWQVCLMSHVSRQITNGLTERYWHCLAQARQRIQAMRTRVSLCGRPESLYPVELAVEGISRGGGWSR